MDKDKHSDISGLDNDQKALILVYKETTGRFGSDKSQHRPATPQSALTDKVKDIPIQSLVAPLNFNTEDISLTEGREYHPERIEKTKAGIRGTVLDDEGRRCVVQVIGNGDNVYYALPLKYFLKR